MIIYSTAHTHFTVSLRLLCISIRYYDNEHLNMKSEYFFFVNSLKIYWKSIQLNSIRFRVPRAHGVSIRFFMFCCCCSMLYVHFYFLDVCANIM